MTDKWKSMAALVLLLFSFAKALTLAPLFFSNEKTSPTRLFGYLFLWPGMNCRQFCGKDFVGRPPTCEWVRAGIKTLVGAFLLWVAVPLTRATHPLLTGWVGMLSIVLLLHFGIFHLLSLAWRGLGIHAKPIMQSPATATSLSKFWSRGWNTAFTDLMHEHVFKPLVRSSAPRRALFTIFLISGALHELVITVPARGGYGFPTIYFGLQGLGVLFEHSRLGRELGLGSGWKGWCFVALMAGLPSVLLFPPVFIHRVILPMLHAFGVI